MAYDLQIVINETTKSINELFMLSNIHIGQETRVKNIQNEFNSLYPFLKIDFLKEQTAKNRKTEKLNPDELIKVGGNLNSANDISITKQRTVAQLKKEFKEKFGLLAEVFRKSGNVWIETSLTDDWTLEQQNKEGEQICYHHKGS